MESVYTLGIQPPTDLEPGEWLTRVDMNPNWTQTARNLRTTPYHYARTRVQWHEQPWIILDAHAQGSGELLVLVSPDCKLIAKYVRPNEVTV